MRKTAAAALVTVLLLAAAAVSYRAYSRRAADAPDVSRLIPGDQAVVSGDAAYVIARVREGGRWEGLEKVWTGKRVRVVSDTGPAEGLWSTSREVIAEPIGGVHGGVPMKFRRYELRLAR
jgi:hypothetical protein